MRDVDGLRDSAEKARQAGGDRRMVVITPELAEQVADLADAADEYRQVALDGERSSAGDHCTRCGCEWPCPTERIRAALARLDGEDTG